MRLLSAIVMVSLLLQPVNVQARRCDSLWSATYREIRLSAIQYKRDFGTLKGWRLLFRYMNKGDLPSKGFFNRYQQPVRKDVFDYWQSVVQLIPRSASRLLVGKAYDFDFIGGIRAWTLDPLVHVGTKRYFGQRMEPSLLLALPIDIAIFSLALAGGYAYYAHKRYEEIVADIEFHSEEWDRYKTDFRYRFIRIQLEEGNITEAQAREWAAVLSQDYQAFMDLLKLSEMDLANQDVQDVLLALPQFSDITQAIEAGLRLEGFKANPGFVEFLTAEQVTELIAQKIFMFLMFDVAYAVIDQNLRADGGIAALAAKVQKSSYTKALLDLRSKGTLNDAQFIYHLQEDLYWQMQFQKWGYLNVQKLKPDSEGRYDGKSLLTLQDVRKSNLKAIVSGYK